jgi:CheY-like chemotaxis protein
MKPILFAEDSEDDVFLLQRAFRRANVPNPLHVARDGREAVIYLENATNPVPGVVVLDVKMPYQGGLEVLSWIRAQPKWNETPVLMMTSSSQDQDIRAAYRLGADAYLVKPSGSEELERLVRQLTGATGRPRHDPVWQSIVCNQPPPPPAVSRPGTPPSVAG